MADRLEFDVTAVDQASKVLDTVQKKADKLEGSDATVDVTADTGKADRELSELDRGLDKLTDADKVVVLALRAGKVQADLTEIMTDLATIDRNDPDVAVTLDNYAKTSAELDSLKQQITDIGATDVKPDVKPVADELDKVGEHANQAQGAVHSMAGNAVGDFAATATGVGPLGEALGQLTELAASGEGSLKQMAVAGLGLGAVSGAILVLNVVMQKFADAAKRAAEIKAFNDKAVKDYTTSILEAQAALDKLNGVEVKDPIPKDANERVKDLAANTAELVEQWSKAGKIEAFNPVTGQIEDMTAKLAAANITADMWADAVINGGVAINKLGTAARDAGLSQETQRQITQTAATEMVKYDRAQQDAADQAKVFKTTVDDATDAQRSQAAETARYQGIADAYGKKVDATVDKLKDLRDSTDDYTAALARMSGDISEDQSLIDLQNQLEDVRQAGVDAMTAQQDADKARASSAKDADEKAAIAAQSMRDYETAVNGAKQSIILIGQTAGATVVDVDSTLQKVDQGDLAGVAADAQGYYKRNPVDIDAHLRFIGAISAGLGKVQVTVGGTSAQTAPAAGTLPAAAPTVTNVYLARPAAARETAKYATRRARINGR